MTRLPKVKARTRLKRRRAGTDEIKSKKFHTDTSDRDETGAETVASNIELSKVPLDLVNTFSDVSDPSGGQALFAQSLEATALGLTRMKFSSSFFRCLQAKLEGALWQNYLRSVTKEDENVIISLSFKRVESFVKYPVSQELLLPYVGKVTMVKSRGSMPFVTLVGVSFFIEDSQSADILIPHGVARRCLARTLLTSSCRPGNARSFSLMMMSNV